MYTWSSVYTDIRIDIRASCTQLSATDVMTGWLAAVHTSTSGAPDINILSTHSDPGKVEFLSEMFPEASEDELHKTLCSCAGDMDTAIQLLLDRPSCPREEVIRKSRNSPPVIRHPTVL